SQRHQPKGWRCKTGARPAFLEDTTWPRMGVAKKPYESPRSIHLRSNESLGSAKIIRIVSMSIISTGHRRTAYPYKAAQRAQCQRLLHTTGVRQHLPGSAHAKAPASVSDRTYSEGRGYEPTRSRSLSATGRSYPKSLFREHVWNRPQFYEPLEV